MNTTTRTESNALAQIPAPAALPMGTTAAAALILSDASMDKMARLADLMASGRSTIPQHLQKSPGDCMAVVMQAVQWGMNPFAVAQKTHIVNGTLGYEAQLVAAVINNSGAVKDRFNFEWFGDWHKIVGKFKTVESRDKKDEKTGQPKKYIVPDWEQKDEQGLGVRVWATIKGEAEPRVLELLMTQARTRNSTLWTEDPKQQLAYLAQKRWARLYAPDVILGVYTPDELDQLPRDMGAAEEVSQWTPDLMTAGDEAAAKGASAYGKWWKTLDANLQKKLVGTKEHQDFKDQALRADAARTIETPPAAAPAPASAPDAAPATNQDTGEIVTTVADVRAKLEAAKNEDALYVAYDWANALTDADQAAHRAELDALFDSRLKAIRGE